MGGDTVHSLRISARTAALTSPRSACFGSGCWQVFRWDTSRPQHATTAPRQVSRMRPPIRPTIREAQSLPCVDTSAYIQVRHHRCVGHGSQWRCCGGQRRAQGERPHLLHISSGSVFARCLRPSTPTPRCTPIFGRRLAEGWGCSARTAWPSFCKAHRRVRWRWARAARVSAMRMCCPALPSRSTRMPTRLRSAGTTHRLIADGDSHAPHRVRGHSVQPRRRSHCKYSESTTMAASTSSRCTCPRTMCVRARQFLSLRWLQRTIPRS